MLHYFMNFPQFMKFYFKTSIYKQSVKPLMNIVPPSGTWHGQWQTMFGSKVIDRGNDDLMLTFRKLRSLVAPPILSISLWRSNRSKFTFGGNDNGQSEREPHGDGLDKQAEAQYEFDQSSLKDNNSSDVKNLIVWHGELRSEWKLRICESIQKSFRPKLAITNTQIIQRFYWISKLYSIT